MKTNTIVLIFLAIVLLTIGTIVAYHNGYQQAILDAELVESNDTGYIISFNGEENWYTFD